MIDGIAQELRNYSDLTLRAELQDKPKEMARLVEQFFHCG